VHIYTHCIRFSIQQLPALHTPTDVTRMWSFCDEHFKSRWLYACDCTYCKHSEIYVIIRTYQHCNNHGVHVVCYGCSVHGAQLVEALLYKPEGRGFDSRWSHWNFSLISFRSDYVPGVDSASGRNEYQVYFLGGKGGRCVGLTTLPYSCAECLEIWEPQPPGTLRACPGL
jgi:hypothetical protein